MPGNCYGPARAPLPQFWRWIMSLTEMLRARTPRENTREQFNEAVRQVPRNLPPLQTSPETYEEDIEPVNDGVNLNAIAEELARDKLNEIANLVKALTFEELVRMAYAQNIGPVSDDFDAQKVWLDVKPYSDKIHAWAMQAA